MFRLRHCWVLLACLALVPSAAGAEPIKLRVTLQLPLTNHLGVNLTQFKTEVEKHSGDTISVEIFDNSRLYRDDQALDAVASGAIEMGSVGISQFVKKMPALDLFGQPFLFNFEALVRAAADPDGDVRKMLDKAVLDRFGVRVLWLQSFGSSVFVSKGRDARTPTAIRGQKVRIWAENMTKIHQGLRRDSSGDLGIQTVRRGQGWHGRHADDRDHQRRIARACGKCWIPLRGRSTQPSSSPWSSTRRCGNPSATTTRQSSSLPEKKSSGTCARAWPTLRKRRTLLRARKA